MFALTTHDLKPSSLRPYQFPALVLIKEIKNQISESTDICLCLTVFRSQFILFVAGDNFTIF